MKVVPQFLNISDQFKWLKSICLCLCGVSQVQHFNPSLFIVSCFEFRIDALKFEIEKRKWTG